MATLILTDPTILKAHSSKRRYEILSRARSHAATISHRKRRTAIFDQWDRSNVRRITSNELTRRHTVPTSSTDGGASKKAHKENKCGIKRAQSDCEVSEPAITNVDNVPPILYWGNSDPFDSLPVLVTPEINDAIMFRRVCFGSGRYSKMKGSEAASTINSIVRSDEFRALRDKSFAAAFLLHCVSVRARVQMRSTKSDSIRHQERMLKLQSFAALRGMLSMQSMQYQVTQCIMWLFKTAVDCGKWTEARTHGVTLRNMLMKEPTLTHDAGFLATAVMRDVHLAIMSTEAPIFSSDWVFSWTKEAFDYASEFDHPPRHLDSSLDEFLSEATHHQRLVSRTLALRRSETKEPVRPAFGALLLMHSLAWSARLLDRARTDCGITGCVAIAMVITAFANGGDVRFGTRRILPTMTVLLNRLQQYIKPWIETPGNAQLYCLFVGAHLEHNENTTDPYQLWFTQAFARLCSQMCLTSWSQTRERLEGFFFLDEIHSNAQVWIENVMNDEMNVMAIEELGTVELKSWITPFESSD